MKNRTHFKASNLPDLLAQGKNYFGGSKKTNWEGEKDKMMDWQAEIINLFRQFKLGNSLFRFYKRISHQEAEYWKNSAIDHKAIMLVEIRRELSDFILQHQESATKETELENGEIEVRTELLVLKMDEFKSIVEAAIQMIPDDKIAEIKAGKSI